MISLTIRRSITSLFSNEALRKLPFLIYYKTRKLHNSLSIYQKGVMVLSLNYIFEMFSQCFIIIVFLLV